MFQLSLPGAHKTSKLGCEVCLFSPHRLFCDFISQEFFPKPRLIIAVIVGKCSMSFSTLPSRILTELKSCPRLRSRWWLETGIRGIWLLPKDPLSVGHCQFWPELSILAEQSHSSVVSGRSGSSAQRKNFYHTKKSPWMCPRLLGHNQIKCYKEMGKISKVSSEVLSRTTV